ncbi:MAG: GDSL-type esterase/lipase family protein [Deltaproteobacteria bacterium]|nr:GDSL-type esterase/lipase family protein [Deltaproteobacteria bacterium]
MLGEIFLQAGSFFVSDRSDGGPRSAKITILSVGDSHTYGAGVETGESYPSHLQRFLDAKAPNRYRVVNLGIPGLNTAQVRHRLPLWASRYDPKVIIVWCGVNNAWNLAEVDSGQLGWRERLEGFAAHSRLYRFVRVAIHDRELEASNVTKAGNDTPWLDVGKHGLAGEMLLHIAGRLERIKYGLSSDVNVWKGMKERAQRDFEAIYGFAESARARLIFVTYPFETEAPFMSANEAIRDVAKQHGLTVIESTPAVIRVPVNDRLFLPGNHPTGPTYREIARDVADAVLQEQ